MRFWSAVLAVILFLASVTSSLAAAHMKSLANYSGVWVSQRVVEETQLQKSPAAPSSIGIALQITETGFEMAWKPSGQRPVRAHFEATNDWGAFTASDMEPPLKAGEKAWAQVDAARLVVTHLSVGGDGKDHIARYELLVSEGWMALRYTVSHGAEVVESVKGRLFRAKIVM